MTDSNSPEDYLSSLDPKPLYVEMKLHKFEHKQLQEQRLQLRQILEEQRREHEQKERLPFKQENYDNCKIKNMCHHDYDEISIHNHDLKSFHDNLPSLSSDNQQLESLVPVSENDPYCIKIQQSRDIQLQELHSFVPSSNEHEIQGDQNIHRVAENNHPSSSGTSEQNTGEFSSHVGLPPPASECNSFIATNALPANIKIIGPESLSQPQKRVVKYFRGKRELSSTAYFDCEWYTCTEVFTDMKIYVEHIEQHIKEISGISCMWRECGADFQDAAELTRHIYFHAFHTKLKSHGQLLQQNGKGEPCKLDSDSCNLVPQIPEPFVCQWEECELSFVSAQHFYWHLDVHCHCAQRVLHWDTKDLKNKELVACGWAGCSFRGDRVSRVRSHVHSHSQEKVAGCPQCGAIFSTKSRFIDHLHKQKPVETMMYQCSACSRRFASERFARDHFRQHINHWKCPHCDMTCTSQSNLDKHIHYRHTEKRQHECHHCNKRFKVAIDLSRHLVTHTGQKLFRCHYPDCGYKVKTFTTLDKHIKKVHLHTKDVYSCHLCPEEYHVGYALSRHLIKLHHLTWPSGHSRFMYRRDNDGRYRLQTVRYESLEMTQGVDPSADSASHRSSSANSMNGEDDLDEDEFDDYADNSLLSGPESAQPMDSDTCNLSLQATPSSVSSAHLSLQATPSYINSAPSSLQATPSSVSSAHLSLQATPSSINSAPLSLQATPSSVSSALSFTPQQSSPTKSMRFLALQELDITEGYSSDRLEPISETEMDDKEQDSDQEDIERRTNSTSSNVRKRERKEDMFPPKNVKQTKLLNNKDETSNSHKDISQDEDTREFHGIKIPTKM